MWGVNLDAVVRKRSGGVSADMCCLRPCLWIQMSRQDVTVRVETVSSRPAAIARDPSKGCDRVSQIPGPAGTPINFGEEKMVTLFPFHVRCGCDSQILVTQTPTARRWKKERAL